MESTDKTISAYSSDGEHAECMRCQKALKTKDIAMFIRTAPSDAFNAWCPTCTRHILVLAARSLDVDDVAGIVIAF